MNKIGIFFGTDTGNTKNIAKLIQKNIGKKKSDVFNISEINFNKIDEYNKLIFGVPTWYYGELQSDWENFFPNLCKIDFRKKYVAIFGCGDQEDYSEYFCDAIGIVYKFIKPLGAKLVGNWLNLNYKFQNSKALINKKYFIGLPIDEDRQPELTNDRIKKWIIQLKKEMNF